LWEGHDVGSAVGDSLLPLFCDCSIFVCTLGNEAHLQTLGVDEEAITFYGSGGYLK